jgi:filamentous hemagglutinin family protein
MKRSANLKFRKIISRLSVIFFISYISLLPSITYANPQGGVVAGGSVVITHPASNTVQINQSSNRAIINWQTYNISQGEKVRYQQPSASSISLNRINPQNGASQIYGTIISNGQVWLINPAGISFGPSAYVNVAGLLASTAGITNKDFLAGRFHFVK